jgi:hypothetical protein
MRDRGYFMWVLGTLPRHPTIRPRVAIVHSSSMPVPLWQTDPATG